MWVGGCIQPVVWSCRWGSLPARRACAACSLPPAPQSPGSHAHTPALHRFNPLHSVQAKPNQPYPYPHRTQQVGATRTDDPAEEVAQKALKSLLNKITKDNFAKITDKVRGAWLLGYGDQ